MNNFDFSTLGFEPEEEIQEEDVFAKLGFMPEEIEEEEPSFLRRAARETGRFVARGAARAGETVAGLPGDIYQFTKWLGGRTTRGRDVPEGYVEKMFGALPTAQQIREKVTQPVTGEYLEPQAPWEEWSDEAISDFASLAIPVKGKIPFARALGTSIFANVGKEMAKGMGAEEKGQMATKLGSMFISGLVGRGTARQYSKELYKSAIESIPEDAAISGEKTLSRLKTLQKQVKKGGISPQKQPTQQLITQLEEVIKNNKGVIPVDELPAFRTTINDYRFDRNLTDRAHYFLNKFDDVVIDSLKDYGKEDPSFLRKYNEARQAYAGVKETNKLARMISKKVDPNNFGTKDLFYLAHIFNVPSLVGAAAGTLSAATGTKILKRFATNPVLRKFYINTIQQGVKGNSAAMMKNLNKLSDAMGKEDWEDIGFEED